MGQLKRNQTILYTAVLVLIWGLSWPIYKIALAYTPPILFAGMRSLLGGLLMGLLLLPKWRHIHWRKSWKMYVGSAFFNTFLFYGLQTIGLNYLPAGLFSVLVYLQPVLLSVFAWLILGESMSAVKLVGLILGFIGVGVISAGGFTGHISIIGLLMGLGSAVSWAIGVVYVKKISGKVDSMWLISFQNTLAGVGLSAIGLATEHVSSIHWNLPYVSGLLYGGILGIPTAFILYFTLVNSGEASKVASSTFLVPLLALVMGTVFLHEPFTLSLLYGLVLIVASILIVNKKAKSTKPTTSDAGVKMGQSA